MPQTPRKIIANDLVRRLAADGILDGDPSLYRRIVIDLEAGHPARIYAEQFADDRWLRAGLGATGIEVTAQPHPHGAFVIDSELVRTGRLALRAAGGPDPMILDGCLCTHHLAGDGSYRRDPNPACEAIHG